MKDSIKELTEGMQRLCAIANKIVAQGETVRAIERDLMLEALRGLYEVTLELEVGGRKTEVGADDDLPVQEMPDEEILSSTVMATMAAMSRDEEVSLTPGPSRKGEGSEYREEKESAPIVEPALELASEPTSEPTPEPEPEPESVEMPKMEDLEDNDNSLLFDEVVIEGSEEAPVQSAEPQEEAPVHKTPGTQASLLDYLKRPVEEKPTVRTLGESLGEKSLTPDPTPLGEGRGGKKVSDLRTVININDKFSFMSELFHNNMKAYNDFILRLNAIDTRDEALMCVNEVSAQYGWDESSVAVQGFYKVFEKKF